MKRRGAFSPNTLALQGPAQGLLSAQLCSWESANATCLLRTKTAARCMACIDASEEPWSSSRHQRELWGMGSQENESSSPTNKSLRSQVEKTHLTEKSWEHWASPAAVNGEDLSIYQAEVESVVEVANFYSVWIPTQSYRAKWHNQEIKSPQTNPKQRISK